MTDRPWLSSYPPGVPADIDAGQYGSLVALIGGAFVLFPAVTQDFAEPYLQWLRDYNDFGGNIAHHLVADGSTGRILVAGIALILVGIVSHNARRRGRREQTIREAIDRRKAAAV